MVWGDLLSPLLFTCSCEFGQHLKEKRLKDSREGSSLPGPDIRRRAQGAGCRPWEMSFATGQASACVLVQIIELFGLFAVLCVCGRAHPPLPTAPGQPVIPGQSREGSGSSQRGTGRRPSSRSQPSLRGSEEPRGAQTFQGPSLCRLIMLEDFTY